MAFDVVPANALVPLFWPEIKPAQSPFIRSLRMLLIGRPNANATGPIEDPIIASDDIVTSFWGRGSQIAHMYETARANVGPFAEIHCMAIGQAPGWIRATGRITVTDTPRRDDNLDILVGGRNVSCIVRTSDTKPVIAARLKKAINRLPDLSIEAYSVDPNTIGYQVKWRGAEGNDIKIILDYNKGTHRTASQILDVRQLSGGVGSPDLETALANLGAQEFDVIVPASYSSEGRISTYSNFMDGVTGRWSPFQQLFGHIFVGREQSFSDLVVYADALNEPHVSVIAESNSPTPAWEWAAAFAAHATVHWAAPPELSRPLQTLVLKNLLVPKNKIDWWDMGEQQQLLEYGISTWSVGPNNTPLIQRVRTLRKDNAYGDPDPSWADAILMFQAMFFSRYMRAEITGKFPRAALSDRNTGIEGFSSPPQLSEVVLQGYLFLQRQGLVENFDLFAAALVSNRNGFDANRVDMIWRPDFVNQLRIVAALIETNLELSRDVVARTAAADAVPD
jgi:phage tail sheath gpL-like